ncbi:Nickel transport system permease protein NikB [subsurface metagenome]
MLLRYITKRILQLIPLLIIISIVTFIIIQLPPGDFLSVYIQRLRGMGAEVTDELIETLKKQHGLDKPVIIQYFIWVKNIITKGDLGGSFLWHKPVTEVIGGYLGMTMLISLLSLIFVWLTAIPIGIYSATHQYTPLDYIFTFFGIVGLAVPGFLVALVLIYVLFSKAGITIIGLFSSEFQTESWSLAKILNMLPRIGLSVFLIGIPSVSWLFRITRGMMLDELGKLYVITARTKGLEEKRLIFKYPLRMAINPLISTIGWMLPALISGEVIISIVLNMPTTGPMLLKALQTQDMYLAGGFLLLVSTLTIVGTLLSDILLAVVDPRIRLGGKSE